MRPEISSASWDPPQALSLKKAGFFSFGPDSESLACLQFLDAGGNVSGTGTTNALGFGLIGCLAGPNPRFCMTKLKPRFGGAFFGAAHLTRAPHCGALYTH